MIYGLGNIVQMWKMCFLWWLVSYCGRLRPGSVQSEAETYQYSRRNVKSASYKEQKCPLLGCKIDLIQETDGRWRQSEAHKDEVLMAYVTQYVCWISALILIIQNMNIC